MTDSTSNRPLRVFLCHASNDKPAVRKLYQCLCADGIDVWLDEENLLPGQHWQVEIPKAVRSSDIVLVCLSKHSINKTGYVQKEIKFALDTADEQPEGTIFLIPLKLEECEVPERLSGLQWVNFYDEGSYARLQRSLRTRARELGVRMELIPFPSSSPNGKAEVKKDVADRDNIIQATTCIDHAAIVQPVKVDQKEPIIQSQDDRVPVSNLRIWGGMQFVFVPAGKFLMGSKGDNMRPANSERQQHTVEIPYDYWIARYPVTNEQFIQFATSKNYPHTQEIWQGQGIWQMIQSDHPVVLVSWRGAMAYCRWLNNILRSELKGLTLRLPTEAEWEKAARGTNGRLWPWGNEFDKTKCNSDVDGKGHTTPVGAYSVRGDSPYGAADMSGNVWEWCNSIFRPYPYRAGDGRERELSNDTRVLRGGSFDSDWKSVCCAYRHLSLPFDQFDDVGFRCVVSPNSSP